ncbi:MAG: M56 family metallopeptidase [Gemmataceae bacterium]
MTNWSAIAVFEFHVTDVAIRLTIVLGVLLMAVGLLQRRTAQVTSAVLNAGLVALLVLPFVVTFAPHIDLPWYVRQSPAAVHPAADGSVIMGAPIETPSEPRMPAVRAVESARLPAKAVEKIEPQTVTPAPVELSLGAILFGLYLGGVAFYFSRLMFTMLAVRRLKNSIVSVTDSLWLERLSHWSQQLGIKKTVSLCQSNSVWVPMTFGWRRPAIIIPQSWSTNGDAVQRDAVLLHELAHVRRSDFAWQFVLRLTQAIYWFHPLVWIMGLCARSTWERACDDVLVSPRHGRPPAAASAPKETLSRSEAILELLHAGHRLPPKR